MIRYAIGEIIVGGQGRGTAFAVNEFLHLTCRHCITAAENRNALISVVEIRYAPGVSVLAKLLDDDEDLDVALLGTLDLKPLPTGWSPVELGSSRDAPRALWVEVEGWPRDSPSATTPQTLHGRVENEHAHISARVEVLQLYSDQLAAGRGLRPRGFSGSPVLVKSPANTVSVGVLRWAQVDEDDHERTVGGVIYATRISDVLARWPALNRKREPAFALAGDAHAPLRAEIEAFIRDHTPSLRGSRPFAGRDAVLKALTDWLDQSQAASVRLVTGNAGIGKSTLLARWAVMTSQQRANVEVVVLPISVRYATNDEEKAVVALAHRLARIHGEIIGPSPSLSAARNALRRLLATPAPAGSKVLVLVDSVDEADGWSLSPPTGLRLLPDEMGDNVRLIVSARHTNERADGAAWARHLGLPDEAVSTLGPLSETSMAELMAQLHPDEDEAVRASASNRLWVLTGGEPVTVALYLADLEELTGTGLAEWTERMHSAPSGLAGFVNRWWLEQEQLLSGEPSRRDDAQRVLRVLATAEGPLTRSELRALASRLPGQLDDIRVDQAVRALARLVLPAAASGSVVVAHPAITQVLRDQLERDGIAEAYRAIFIRWGAETLERLRDGDLDAADVPDYLFRHLAAHLAHGERFDQLAMEVTGSTWRRARDAMSDELSSLRRDVQLVTEHAQRLDRRRRERGHPPRLLPERILCAAELASEQGALATTMSAPLAVALVQQRQWQPGRALRYVAGLVNDDPFTSADPLASICPITLDDQLSELAQLVRLVLPKATPVEEATLVAAWAVRLLERDPSEALALAKQPPVANDLRHFVTIWALAELIPRLPDDLAASALQTALADASSGHTVEAVGVLTRRVSIDKAARLWLAVDETAARVPAPEPVSTWQDVRPRALVVAALDRWGRSEYRTGWPFLRRDPFGRQIGELDAESFVAAAPWMTEEQRSETIRYVLERSHADEHATKRAISAIGPQWHFDGLLDVIPSADAPEAVAWVEKLAEAGLPRGDRLYCLAQLLPGLDGGLRERVTDSIFEALASGDVKGGISSRDPVAAAVPKIVAGGERDRLFDLAIHLPGRLWAAVVMPLAPHLSEAQTVALLDGREEPVGIGVRRALLARLASFGPQQAARTTARFYTDALPDSLVTMLRTSLGGDGPEPDDYDFPDLHSWWRDAFPSSHPEVGPFSFPSQPRKRDEHELSHAVHHVTGRSFSVDLAIDLAGGMTANLAELVVERAHTLSDRWQALVLLCAGTHLPPGPAGDAVQHEIRALIGELRTAADSSESWSYADDAPWLARGFSGWVPYVARIVAPQARAQVAELLCADGYLDGVPRTHGDERYDPWAHGVLTLTPLLDAEQLAALEAGQRRISSGTLRSHFFAGLAVGYAACGRPGDAFRLIQNTTYGPDPVTLFRHAFIEILTLIGTDELGDWIVEVHRRFDNPLHRGPMWAAALSRFSELSDEQLWVILDRWLSLPRTGGRIDVFADVLFYRHAVARLAGKPECLRLLRLIERRVVLTDLER